MLAAADISFTQKVVGDREKFLKMAERQLPFGQLPLLQIDGQDIVQSQAIVRYIARRAKLTGKNMDEELKCDMIAESVHDLLVPALAAPFRKYSGTPEDYAKHKKLMLDKWNFIASRYEAIMQSNVNDEKKPEPRGVMVGTDLTYADILVAHLTTWYVEECGPEILSDMPLLTALQNVVISLPGIQSFIRSVNYFSLGDAAYCEKVNEVLGRKI